MAQYFRTFANDTVGQQPANTTLRWSAQAGDWVVRERNGENVLVYEGSTAGNSDYVALSFDAIDADAKRDDIEIAINVRIPASEVPLFRLFGRGSGAADSEAFYGALYDHFDTGEQDLTAVANGSNQGTLASASRSLSDQTWYWMRFRVNAFDLMQRIWAESGAEPGSWDLSVTDGDEHVSGVGWAGLVCLGEFDEEIEVRAVGLGTNGDTAPSEVPSGEATGDIDSFGARSIGEGDGAVKVSGDGDASGARSIGEGDGAVKVSGDANTFGARSLADVEAELLADRNVNVDGFGARSIGEGDGAVKVSGDGDAFGARALGDAAGAVKVTVDADTFGARTLGEGEIEVTPFNVAWAVAQQQHALIGGGFGL